MTDQRFNEIALLLIGSTFIICTAGWLTLIGVFLVVLSARVER